MINSFFGEHTTSGYTDHTLLNTQQPLLVMRFQLMLLVLICIPNLFFLFVSLRHELQQLITYSAYRLLYSQLHICV